MNMSTGATLTLELFTEELPPKALKKLGEAFAEGICDGLRDRGFLDAASTKAVYATPRRLAVKLTHVLPVSPDKPFTQKLMPVSVALDAGGKPTMAMRKRLEALGRAALADHWPNASEGPDRLTSESDGKAEAIFLHSVAKGSPLQAGLQAALEGAIAALPIPKVMTYQRTDGSNVKFVRPCTGCSRCTATPWSPSRRSASMPAARRAGTASSDAATSTSPPPTPTRRPSPPRAR